MKKLFFCLGTRPEFLKLAPIIRKWDNKFVMNTGQQMTDMIDFLDINVDLNLNLPSVGLGLFNVVSGIKQIRDVITQVKPDYVVVQGDTSSAYVGALSAYYLQIPIIHIEAGLRTNNYLPFPEEFHRKSIDYMSDILFAPTYPDYINLYDEGVNGKIHVVGNTIVDELSKIIKNNKIVPTVTNKILVTLHRRETNKNLEIVLTNLSMLKNNFPEFEFIYPVHPNNRETVHKYLGSSFTLINPLQYVDFIRLMAECYLVITDSGGIQEEAPTLHKPVIVMREHTERNDLISSGGGFLVGYDWGSLFSIFSRLVKNEFAYAFASSIENPFGYGNSSDIIVGILNEQI